MSGDWAGAVACWSERGCVYEAALARSSSNDEGAMREALSELQASAPTRRLASLPANCESSVRVTSPEDRARPAVPTLRA